MSTLDQTIDPLESPKNPLVGKAWQIPVTHATDGLQRQAAANDEEHAALEAALAITALDEFTCDIDIAPPVRHHFTGTVSMRARIKQTCVVSLEPFDTVIEEEIPADFWPQSHIDAWLRDLGPEAEIDAETPDPEPIEDDKLDIGRIVFETLVVAIDPHPRAPGAELEYAATETPADIAAENPFAALAALRDGKPKD